ncbi:unnamed protein product [Xylocopa violacea]|uniref:UDP-glucuronosyltransferase n=1 Tax=Xylocopa violacea TaxID=135666 RepID=A0ABP1NXZ5_XYLVO
MKFAVAVALFWLCILSVSKQSEASRILIVFGAPSISHQIPFLPLWNELSKRGHELVIVAPDVLLDTNSTNIRHISTRSSYSHYKKISYIQQRLNGVSWMKFVKNNAFDLISTFTHYTFNNSEVRKLYAPDSAEKFDLIMIEMLIMHCCFALAHRFNAPVIGLNTFGITALDSYVLGDMILPSHDSTWELEANTGADLSFWNRLKNFCSLWHYIYYLYRYLVPLNQKLAEQYFGTPLPQLVDIVANTSLVFVNLDRVMTYARPELPNVIKFHSMHNVREPEPLSQNLQSFIDDASNGFIYFCMGTNVRFLDLTDEIQQIFYDVFADLPYKIVWKIDELPSRKLNNVYASPWLPQQNILAHPNIKLYMYHGGAMSTQEAIHYIVPVLGFPVLSDQEFQLKKLMSFGVGKRLYLETLTREALNSTIRETISNQVYKQNMLKLRTLLQDTSYDSVKNLVWWTEFVIRNKGAPHLRSNIASQSWYKYYDMDIVVFLTATALMIGIIALVVCVKLVVYASRRYRRIPLDRTKKMN